MDLMAIVALASLRRRSSAFASARSSTLDMGRVLLRGDAPPEPLGIPARHVKLNFARRLRRAAIPPGGARFE
eukprot:1606819-Pyramimonas_sp.AAC.1